MGTIGKDLDDYVEIFHKNAVTKGFYLDFDLINSLLLLNCEISEAIEADRKWLHAKEADVQKVVDAYNEGSESWTTLFEFLLKDTFEMELTDFFIRCLDLYGYELENDRDTPTLQKYLDDVSELLSRLVWDDEKGKKTYTNPKKILLLMEKYVAWMAETDDIAGHLCDVIYLVMYLAKYEYDFELIEFAELKHRYNVTREFKHGKRY
jgi:hypothetical protein